MAIMIAEVTRVMADQTDKPKFVEMKNRFVPLIKAPVRTAIGLLLAFISPIVAARLLGTSAPGAGVILLFVVVAWLPAVYLTDKYVHKYPYRYYSYLAASHLKSAVVMALFVAVISLVAGRESAPLRVLFLAVIILAVADALVSALRRRAPAKVLPRGAKAAETVTPGDRGSVERPAEETRVVDSAAILDIIRSRLPPRLADFIGTNLPPSKGPLSSVVILDDIASPNVEASREAAGLVVGTTPLNHVRRLNLFLNHCTNRLAMGGYLVLRYTPLEEVNADLRRRYPGVLYVPAFALHFLLYRALPKIPWVDKLFTSPVGPSIDKVLLKATKRRNRVLSKAEVWGRLAYYGIEVLAEEVDAGERVLLAKRVGPPVANRKPSFYAIVALEKVGLDGEVMRLHKVRSMYPFSEFLQKAIFQSHGLSATGKFKNDFRITEYGKLFRRHWIDELPGLYDWLRGDIKLVGMRATSPHFLSLYPKEVYDKYIQIKPGLVPPIFDEKTAGFEQIVEVEDTYLRRYLDAPVKTDIQYFWYTFRDIFIRKVRSH